MLSMNKRMTIRTKNHKILPLIIISIFINMMNAKNFFYFVIATFFTFNDDSSALPKSSKSICIFWLLNICFSMSISASFCAAFSFFGRRIKKYSSTIFAFFEKLITVITCFRTIFSGIFSIKPDFKFFITTFTDKRDHLCL